MNIDQKAIEKICRQICKLKNIDPDRLYSPHVPEMVNAPPNALGFYIPIVQAPIWTSFISDAQLAINVIGEFYWLKEK